MRIALTGAASTGKTTLARELMKAPELKDILKTHLNVDARKIQDEMGERSIDMMSPKKLQEFQMCYFSQKKQLEKNRDSYIVERSFIDIAVYWILRDAKYKNEFIQQKVVEACKTESKRYDLHIFLPFGIIPFENDGYRSLNMEHHYEFSEKVKYFLKEWELEFIELNCNDLNQRISKAVKKILSLL
jgi:nicotinamide riboside kinase